MPKVCCLFLVTLVLSPSGWPGVTCEDTAEDGHCTEDQYCQENDARSDQREGVTDDDDDELSVEDESEGEEDGEGRSSDTVNEYVYIPGGEFTMGTNEPVLPQDGEGPARRVQVSGFFMQRYEVSNREFAAFTADTYF